MRDFSNTTDGRDSMKVNVSAIAREVARERIGQPKSGKLIPDKRKKKLEKINSKELRSERDGK